MRYLQKDQPLQTGFQKFLLQTHSVWTKMENALLWPFTALGEYVGATPGFVEELKRIELHSVK